MSEIAMVKVITADLYGKQYDTIIDLQKVQNALERLSKNTDERFKDDLGFCTVMVESSVARLIDMQKLTNAIKSD